MAYWMINNVVAKRPSTERVLVLGKKKRERERERERERDMCEIYERYDIYIYER